MAGSLAISAFDDLKPRGTDDFSPEEKDHILDMARTFMKHVGLCRPFLVVVLSDGVRWQFFRIKREKASVFKYLEGPVLDDATVGWQYYHKLLKSPASEMRDEAGEGGE